MCVIFQKKLQWEMENETLKCELLVLKNQVTQFESSDVMERSVATQCCEEMFARDYVTEQENTFHKWTDEYKLSLGANLEKNFQLPYEAGNCSVPQNLSNPGQRNYEFISLFSPTTSESCSSPKTTTDMSELRPETKIGAEQRNGVTGDGLMAHNRCKDRETEEMRCEVERLKRKLNQSQAREHQMMDQLMFLEEEKNRQINLLQQQMDFFECPIMSNQQTAMEMERPGTGQADPIQDGPNIECHMCGSELTSMNGERNEEFSGKRERIVRLKLDTTLNWVASPADVFMSTPVSGDFSFCPNLGSSDSREEQLHQQVFIFLCLKNYCCVVNY